MKCIKCQTKNINQANYCKNCGNEFTEKEKKAAARWTFVWILEKIEKGISIFKGEFKILSIVTDTLVFKILSIVIVLAVGVNFYMKNGNEVQIREGEDYRVQYNTETDEYYVLVNEKETRLNVYVPNDVEKMDLRHYDEKGNILDEKELSTQDDIVLEAADEDYYVLNVVQGKKNIEFKLSVFLGAL